MFLLNMPFLLSASMTEAVEKEEASGVIDGVTNIADSISKHGPVIVICAVFIVLFILILILFLKINNDMIKNMIEQMNKKSDENADITQKLLDHFLDEEEEEQNIKEEQEKEGSSEEIKKKHSKDLIGLYIDYTTAFKREFKKVINTLRCDRVAVYVFHNGNQTLYGLPFIKMSCVHEDTVKGNMTMRGKSHVNLPLHLFNDFIQELYTNGVFAGNVSEIEIRDNSIREFLAYSDAKAVFMKSIQKDDGSLAGFTVCEFNREIDFTNKDTYTKINSSIKEANTAIRYIVTDEEFSKKYENHK